MNVDLRLSTAYHPETDGSTERYNRTIAQMLTQCVSLSQKDWSTRLPAIEFAINSARSSTTGFSPFFLNTGRTPSAMHWNASGEQFPGVRVFAERIQMAIISAHDAILSARVKQTGLANRKQRPAPFELGNLVYLSTENLSIPKGRSRKLNPKFLGPFKIIGEIVPRTTFKLELPAELLQRGIHNVFHSKYLRIHVPNDDRRFPARSMQYVKGFGPTNEWVVDRILSHSGFGDNTVFQLRWKAGDVSWLRLADVKHLDALQAYLEANGTRTVAGLSRGLPIQPAINDPELSLSSIHMLSESLPVQKGSMNDWKNPLITDMPRSTSRGCSTSRSASPMRTTPPEETPRACTPSPQRQSPSPRREEYDRGRTSSRRRRNSSPDHYYRDPHPYYRPPPAEYRNSDRRSASDVSANVQANITEALGEAAVSLVRRVKYQITQRSNNAWHKKKRNDSRHGSQGDSQRGQSENGDSCIQQFRERTLPMSPLSQINNIEADEIMRAASPANSSITVNSIAAIPQSHSSTQRSADFGGVPYDPMSLSGFSQPNLFEPSTNSHPSPANSVFGTSSIAGSATTDEFNLTFAPPIQPTVLQQPDSVVAPAFANRNVIIPSAPRSVFPQHSASSSSPFLDQASRSITQPSTPSITIRDKTGANTLVPEDKETRSG